MTVNSHCFPEQLYPGFRCVFCDVGAELLVFEVGRISFLDFEEGGRCGPADAVGALSRTEVRCLLFSERCWRTVESLAEMNVGRRR